MLAKESIERVILRKGLIRNGNKPVRELLFQLMDGQKVSQETWEDKSLTSGIRKDMLGSFQESPRFREIYLVALNFHLFPHTDQELKSFRARVAGAVFEGVAIKNLFLSTLQPQIALTPDRVLKLYQRLHPNAIKQEAPLGASSLRGISVPDSLIVESYQPERARIVAACEVSLSGNPNYYLRHYHGFTRDREKYPRVFRNAQLIFVTPREPYLPYEVRKAKEVEIRELPFMRKQFRGYIDSLYGSYRPDPDDSTVLEAQQWARQRSGIFK